MNIIGLEIDENTGQLFTCNLETNKLKQVKVFSLPKRTTLIDFEALKKIILDFLKEINFDKNKKDFEEFLVVNFKYPTINEKWTTFIKQITNKNCVLWTKTTMKEIIANLEGGRSPLLKPVVEKIDIWAQNLTAFLLNQAIKTNQVKQQEENKNFIIVDLNSITSFFVITGRWLAGKIIAPGLDLSKKSLIANAELISDFAGYEFDSVLTSGTKKAVSAGVVLNQLGLIEYTVKKVQQKLKGETEIVLTGHNLKYLEPHLKLSFAYQIEKNLMLAGIVSCYQALK